MSTNWTPSAGMRRAHDLVEKLAAEAPNAESLITPLFKHRMVEAFAAEIDEALDVALNDMADRAEAAAAVTDGGPVQDDYSELDVKADPTPSTQGWVELRPSGKDGIVTTGYATGTAADRNVFANGNGTHAEPAAPAPVKAPQKTTGKKAKGKNKKGTLKLSGAAGRLAAKKLKEAADAQAMENLPVPIDGLERM